MILCFKSMKNAKDYIYMWSYAYQKSEFYLQLEDDLIAKDDYMEFIVDQLTTVTEARFQISIRCW